MIRKCSCCTHPTYDCTTCPITLNYWTSLPQGFIISTSGTTTSGLTEERIRKIVQEELEKSKQTYKLKPGECVLVKTENLSFEEALTALKAGEWITRTDWNGVWQSVFMMEGERDHETPLLRNPFLVLYNTQREYVPWVPSTGDLFSNKWKIIKSIS